ncbi:MAG: DUF2510 domain-containing protein [Cryobacterium sp.]|nr:DUF2510 domain-containing protein [Cryobacterium sp.]
MTMTPAGWYPDPENTTQLRWWDGAQWTENRSASPVANAATPYSASPEYSAAPAYSAGAPSLKAPDGTRWNTVWIWIILVLPYISSLGIFTIDWSSLFDFRQLSQGASEGASARAMFSVFASPGYLFTLVGGWVAYGLGAWFSYLDYRKLARRGVPKPFHWAWAFIPSYPVYVIGRSVVVRRRTGSGIAPMWIAIALLVLSFIISIVWILSLMGSVLTQMPQYSGTLSP